MKAQAKELLKVAKSIIAEPMTFDEPTTETTRWAERTLKSALRVDSSWKKVYELFLTVREGSSNKFHYFAIYLNRQGEAVGGNAFGRIGYNPKAIEVARGDYPSVTADIQSKVRVKMAKGYAITEV